MPRVKVTRKVIREFLDECQRNKGGITGKDLAEFADRHDLHPVTFRRRVLRLLTNDPDFGEIIYRGKRPPPLDYEEFARVIATLMGAPLTPPTTIVSDLNRSRQAKGIPPIPLRTAYRTIRTQSKDIRADRKDSHSWLDHMGIPLSLGYDVAVARRGLDTHFTWSGLTTPYGFSITKTTERLREAESFFEGLHPGCQPHQWYEDLRTRSPCLSSFLSSVSAEREPALSARFTFECQALWITEARDLLLDQLRMRKRRLGESLRARSQRKVIRLLKEREAGWVELAKRVASDPSPINREMLLSWANMPNNVEDQALVLLLTKARVNLTNAKLLVALHQLTRGFRPEEMNVRGGFGLEILLQLAREEKTWRDLTEDEAVVLGRLRHFLPYLPQAGQYALIRAIITDHLVGAISDGRITLRRSWSHQDIGERIASVPLPENKEDWLLPPATLDALLTGTYPIDFSPIGELRKNPPESIDEEEDACKTRVGFLDLAQEVHEVVLEHNPDWYLVHRRTLEDFWDGTFRMGFRERAFTERLHLAVGLLGRNYRIRDYDNLQGLRHFLRRYVTPATLETELRFYHETLAALTGKRVRAIIVDTVGREARSTHPLSTWHPRYLLQGFADLRGIGESRLPLYSFAISSRDSEAMNALEIVARARRVADDGIRLYLGNGHTVSRVSAGLLFGTFGVVSAGHIVHPPAALDRNDREWLSLQLPRLNQLFFLLRWHPELGRVFASRQEVHLPDGTELRGPVERLGAAVIHAVEATGHDWRVAQPYIESSNALKRAVTTAAGGAVRVEPHRQDLSLLAGELILVMATLRAYLRRKAGDDSALSTGLSEVALFRPT